MIEVQNYTKLSIQLFSPASNPCLFAGYISLSPLYFYCLLVVIIPTFQSFSILWCLIHLPKSKSYTDLKKSAGMISPKKHIIIYVLRLQRELFRIYTEWIQQFLKSIQVGVVKHEDAPLILYVSWFMLLSGKHTKNSPFGMGKSTISMAIFNSKLWMFTRVWLAGKSPGPTISPANIELRDSKMHFPMVFPMGFPSNFPKLIHDFPMIVPWFSRDFLIKPPPIASFFLPAPRRRATL